MLILLSLIGTASGVLVDMLLARIYGTSPVADAYRASSLFLTLGLQLFVSQAMLSVVVGLLTRGPAAEPGTAILALRRVAGMAILVLVPVAVVSLVAAAHADAVLRWMTPGLAPAVAAAAGPMVSAFLLMMMPVTLIGVTGAVLQVYGRFWLMGVYRLTVNGLLILFVWFAGDGGDGHALIAAQLVAVLATAVLSVGVLVRLREQGRPIIVAMMPPRIDRTVVVSFRVTGGPLGLILTTNLFGFTLLYALSRQPAGAIAEYAYATKFVSLTDVVPAAIISVLFPNLAALWIHADRTELTRLVARAMGIVGAASALSGLVLIIASSSMVDLLLAHGRLSTSDAAEIARGVVVLAIGAPAAAFAQILIPLCYVTGRQWRLVTISIVQFLVLALSLPLVDGRGYLVVLAVFTLQLTLSAVLLFDSAVRSGLAIGGPIRSTALRLIPCLAGTAAAVELARWSCGVLHATADGGQVLDLTIIGLVSPLAFYGMARLVRLKEIEPLDGLLRTFARRVRT